MAGLITHDNVGAALDSTEWSGNTTHLIGGVSGLSVLVSTDIEDTATSGHTANPISSNWAYVHSSTADPHSQYLLESAYTAKGTLIVGTSSGGYTALAAPASSNDGRVLTAKSTETCGLKWDTAAASGMTEAYGTGSVTSGSTHDDITHSLGNTPNIIVITFTEQGTNDYGCWWVGNLDSTGLTVYVTSDPGASNLDFMWYARYEA
jgi:hypothetical protein